MKQPHNKTRNELKTNKQQLKRNIPTLQNKQQQKNGIKTNQTKTTQITRNKRKPNKKGINANGK